MKKLFITFFVMIAVCLAGFASSTAFTKIYVCGGINGQGWKPKLGEAIELTTVTNGWFKLDVTSLDQFKVSSTAGDGWDDFNAGNVIFNLSDKSLNGEYDAQGSSQNSVVPNGTKVIYFSNDLKKCAVSDGTWTPAPYGTTTTTTYTYNVKVDASIPGWTSVKCYYWDGSTNNWDGVEMTSEGNGIFSYGFNANSEPKHLLFHNGLGGNANQTADLDFENNKTYVLRSQGSDSKWTETAVGGSESTYTYNVKVDVSIPGWTSVKCYYWDGSTNNWDGVTMTPEGNGIFSYGFNADSEPRHLLFHNGLGGDANQTADLDFENNKTYVLRSQGTDTKWTETATGTETPEPTPLPSNLKFWSDAEGANNWTASDIPESGSVTITVGNEYYFTFTTDGGWGGAWRPTSGSDYVFTDNGTVSATGSGDGCFVIKSAGTYTITPHANKTITVTGFDARRYASNTLPLLYINIYKTDDNGDFILDENGNKIYDNYQLQVEEIDKEYRSGEYWLDMNGSTLVPGENIGSAEAPLALEMKGRGNWTRRGFAKKPFKLKLGKKQCLLGMGEKSKHWAILAHADDNYGYMRNFTGFNLGKRIGLPWTPSQQPVEVIINGNYRGLYFLTESIRVGDGRVPIQELGDEETSKALISGGYLVELDNYDEENQIRMAEKTCIGNYCDMLRITFDTPEVYSDIQRQFVEEQFTTMNNLVGKANTPEGDELWSYLDLDDAARYYLIMEICSHTESYHGSTYLFRDRGHGQKWHFSPIWDMGNAFNGPTNDYFYKSAPFGTTWLPSILTNQKFRNKVEETWKWFMQNCYDGYMNDLEEYANTIAEAAKADKARWDGQPTPAGGQPVVDNSDIQSKKTATKDHIDAKLNWLKNEFGAYNNALYAEPDRDTTPAAALPSYSYTITGLEDINADTTVAPVYYNLQGVRVNNPAPGNIYIEVRGKASMKVAF